MRPGRDTQSQARLGQAEPVKARLSWRVFDLFCAVLTCFLLLHPAIAFGWANSTHFMIGQQLSMRDSLPDACYLPEFIACANAPDIFADSGPEFAHSDMRFVEILFELAGEDQFKQAYVYGCVGHIAADAVVHGDFVSQTGFIHRLREIACSSLIYWTYPELQHATRFIGVHYDPQMLIRASELFVERYGEGRALSSDEIHQKARTLGLGLLGQYVLVHSELVGRWAENYLGGEDWEPVFLKAVDSAYTLIRDMSSGLEPSGSFAANPSSGDLSPLSAFGQQLCDAGLAQLNTHNNGGFVELEFSLSSALTDSDDHVDVILSRDEDADDNPLLSLIRLAVSEQTRSAVSSAITLSPAFPNPFNSETRCVITSQIFVDNINISVVNALGQCVYRLYEGSLSYGSHELRWSGSDEEGRSVASGVYFIVARGKSDFPLIQKMMLIK